MILFLADHWTSTIHTTQEELKKRKNHQAFWIILCLRKTQSHDTVTSSFFEKLSFQNVSRQYENEKLPFSNSFMSSSMVTRSLLFEPL